MILSECDSEYLIIARVRIYNKEFIFISFPSHPCHWELCMLREITTMHGISSIITQLGDAFECIPPIFRPRACIEIVHGIWACNEYRARSIGVATEPMSACRRIWLRMRIRSRYLRGHEHNSARSRALRHRIANRYINLCRPNPFLRRSTFFSALWPGRITSLRLTKPTEVNTKTTNIVIPPRRNLITQTKILRLAIIGQILH